MTRHQPTASNAEPKLLLLRYSGMGSHKRYIAESICDMVIAYPVGDRPLTCFAKFITRGPALVLERREFVAKEFVALECPSLRSIEPIKSAIDNHGHNPQQCAPGTRVWCRLQDNTGNCLYFRC